MKKIIEEYDKDGNLIKKTTIIEDEKDCNNCPFKNPYINPYEPTIWIEDDDKIDDIQVTWKIVDSNESGGVRQPLMICDSF